MRCGLKTNIRIGIAISGACPEHGGTFFRKALVEDDSTNFCKPEKDPKLIAIALKATGVYQFLLFPERKGKSVDSLR